MNIFEMKQNLYQIGQELASTDDKIAKAAASPADNAVDELKTLQNAKDSLQTRYNALNEQVKAKEAEDKAKLSHKAKPVDAKDRTKVAFGQLVRVAVHGKAPSSQIYQDLGASQPLADNTETNGGYFLPKTVSTNIITPPEETNPLRQLSTITNIPNLEVPILNYKIDGQSFINDTDTAQEIETAGDHVSFTRNKFKIMVPLSETVLLGSNADLSNYVMQELRNGLIAKERSVAFNPAPTADAEKHMSFYDASNNIKSISGSDMFETLMDAIDDIPEGFRDNVSIVMSQRDYHKMLLKLSNNSTTLYGVQPQDVLGYPVQFTDAAVKPIVGDFSFSHYNYDIPFFFDRDKNVQNGIWSFVLTAYMDHRIKLANAFRIVDTTSGTTSGTTAGK